MAHNHDVIDLALATRNKIEHFVDVNKMLGHRIDRQFTSRLRLLNDRRKITPFRIAKQVLKITRQPVFHDPSNQSPEFIFSTQIRYPRIDSLEQLYS
jgi:hypothetical protein